MSVIGSTKNGLFNVVSIGYVGNNGIMIATQKGCNPIAWLNTSDISGIRQWLKTEYMRLTLLSIPTFCKSVPSAQFPRSLRAAICRLMSKEGFGDIGGKSAETTREWPTLTSLSEQKTYSRPEGIKSRFTSTGRESFALHLDLSGIWCMARYLADFISIIVMKASRITESAILNALKGLSTFRVTELGEFQITKAPSTA